MEDKNKLAKDIIQHYIERSERQIQYKQSEFENIMRFAGVVPQHKAGQYQAEKDLKYEFEQLLNAHEPEEYLEELKSSRDYNRSMREHLVKIMQGDSYTGGSFVTYALYNRSIIVLGRAIKDLEGLFNE